MFNKNFRRKTLVFISIIACGIASVCTVQTTAQSTVIRLATTTSTENSGLLEFLLPHFTRTTGYRVHVIAVGTGKALRMGRDGDVDIVLVHAPASEKLFVESGYGSRRHAVMYNDFVLIGPASDPAMVKTAKDIRDAFLNIHNTSAIFISRGDNSGTHKKERYIWQTIQTSPGGNWYREAGQGMGKVIQMAGELNAYTITDRGTWLKYRKKSPLRVLFEGDPDLHNPYSIIAVSPERYSDLNITGAQALINWITSESGQELIGSYRVDNTRLFVPSSTLSGFADGSKKSH